MELVIKISTFTDSGASNKSPAPCNKLIKISIKLQPESVKGFVASSELLMRVILKIYWWVISIRAFSVLNTELLTTAGSYNQWTCNSKTNYEKQDLGRKRVISFYAANPPASLLPTQTKWKQNTFNRFYRHFYTKPLRTCFFYLTGKI